MRLLIFLVFVKALLMKDVALSTVHKNPTNLAWLFGINEKSNEIQKETRTVCQTEECQKIAKVILESMDKSVDPCNDFYEYTCGKWPEHNPIPNDTDSWSLWHVMMKNIDQQIQEILEAGPKDDDILAVKLAKKWYMACMDTDAMEKQGLDPLVFTLSRIGGWPITMDPDEWNEKEYTWQKVDDQYARLIGRNAFHDVRVYESNLNDSEKTVIIDTPHLPTHSYMLWSMLDEDSDEEEENDENPSDEDPSDEEKHSDERKGSQEPGSEEDDKDDGNNQDKSKSNDDGGDNDDEDDNNEIDTSYSNNFKRSKSNKMSSPKKNKNSSHDAKRESSSHAKKKYSSQKTNKHRLKRAIAAKINSKRTHHLIHRNKLNMQKSKRKSLGNVNEEHVSHSTTPHSITTEEPSSEELTLQIRQEYVDFISKVVRAIAKVRGTKISEEQLDKDVQDLIDFQLKLSEITFEAGEELEVTINDFQEWYDNKEPETSDGQIDWGYKISELFDEAGVYVDSDLEIEVSSPDYFGALLSLLDETSTRTIVNYIHWNFVSRILKTTTNEMRKLYDSWQGSEDEETERSSKCIDEVEINQIVSYEYVRQHFPDKIAKTVMDMIDDIEKEVEYQIKEAEWMDEDTKDFILAKLMNMKKFIGYPDWYRNTTIIKRYIQGLIIDKSYYENTLSYNRFVKWKKLRELNNDDDDADDVEMWWISPMTLNAGFMPDENSITVPAVDFQSPFFSRQRPQTINFGIIGVIIGHEINHGFDDDGHLYNKNGEFVKWLPAMAEAYGKRAGCFVDQFNNYRVNKMSDEKIENYGNQTAGENIADTMALEAVFRAYRRRQRECGQPNAGLPGLEDFTNDQLFFLSFGNLWCEATNSDPMVDAKFDPHSPGRLRVIGSVSNSNDFAKAFNCPVKSAMNPKKKCNIWK